MRNLSQLFCSLLFLLPVGCAVVPPPPEMSPLQVRELQTRVYEHKNSLQVQKAVFDVLQDDGYVVKNAESEIGLLTATKEMSLPSSSRSGGFGGGFLGGGFGTGPYSIWGSPSRETWPVLETFEASVNVSPFGATTKVRVTFQRRVINNLGAPIESEMIRDPAFYQEFFSRVDKSLFLVREQL